FQCNRDSCRAQVKVCPSCDRGQRYCGETCRAEQRRATQRRAGTTYQGSRRGKRLHAARQQRYLERKRFLVGKFSAQKVTHHGSTQPKAAAMTAGASSIAGDGIPEVPNEPLERCAASEQTRGEATNPERDGTRHPEGAFRSQPTTPASDVDAARGVGAVQRASFNRCSFCGNELTGLAVLSSTRQRTLARGKSTRGLHRRAPRQTTGPPQRAG